MLRIPRCCWIVWIFARTDFDNCGVFLAWKGALSLSSGAFRRQAQKL
jgi:hypothetical protein